MPAEPPITGPTAAEAAPALAAPDAAAATRSAGGMTLEDLIRSEPSIESLINAALLPQRPIATVTDENPDEALDLSAEVPSGRLEGNQKLLDLISEGDTAKLWDYYCEVVRGLGLSVNTEFSSQLILAAVTKKRQTGWKPEVTAPFSEAAMTAALRMLHGSMAWAPVLVMAGHMCVFGYTLSSPPLCCVVSALIRLGRPKPAITMIEGLLRNGQVREHARGVCVCLSVADPALGLCHRCPSMYSWRQRPRAARPATPAPLRKSLYWYGSVPACERTLCHSQRTAAAVNTLPIPAIRPAVVGHRRGVPQVRLRHWALLYTPAAQERLRQVRDGPLERDLVDATVPHPGCAVAATAAAAHARRAQRRLCPSAGAVPCCRGRGLGEVHLTELGSDTGRRADRQKAMFRVREASNNGTRMPYATYELVIHAVFRCVHVLRHSCCSRSCLTVAAQAATHGRLHALAGGVPLCDVGYLQRSPSAHFGGPGSRWRPLCFSAKGLSAGAGGACRRRQPIVHGCAARWGRNPRCALRQGAAPQRACRSGRRVAMPPQTLSVAGLRVDKELLNHICCVLARTGRYSDMITVSWRGGEWTACADRCAGVGDARTAEAADRARARHIRHGLRGHETRGTFSECAQLTRHARIVAAAATTTARTTPSAWRRSAPWSRKRSGSSRTTRSTPPSPTCRAR
jgi:hypothetical protein